ncbi:MAG: hypothetical protein LBG57_09735 [Treponema sp.]|nr:hypothetical protein [Treponema sp.]
MAIRAAAFAQCADSALRMVVSGDSGYQAPPPPETLVLFCAWVVITVKIFHKSCNYRIIIHKIYGKYKIVKHVIG